MLSYAARNSIYLSTINKQTSYFWNVRSTNCRQLGETLHRTHHLALQYVNVAKVGVLEEVSLYLRSTGTDSSGRLGGCFYAWLWVGACCEALLWGLNSFREFLEVNLLGVKNSILSHINVYKIAELYIYRMAYAYYIFFIPHILV